MKVKTSWASLRGAKWYEYAERFVIGGAITATASIIAKAYGPKVGGLFLAFPAIFPLTATLIDKHEKEHKQRAGMGRRRRARQVVAVDAAGATLGAIALVPFAVLASWLLPALPGWPVLAISTVAWLAVAVGLWWITDRL